MPGQRIPTLQEVFDLVRASGRDDIRMNIETKISPLVQDTADYETFTRLLVGAIEEAGFTDRVTIQSFDWRTIDLARQLDPHIETVALVWQYGPAECASLADECSLQAVYGDPSVRSPWTGRLDWWQHQDLGLLVKQIGASTVSSNGRYTNRTRGTCRRRTGTCGRTRRTSTARPCRSCRGRGTGSRLCPTRSTTSPPCSA
ncbi:MAG TPA: glycerophosphodiester phosphodiesterase family protein [Pseudonocardiaceae bacterium]